MDSYFGLVYVDNLMMEKVDIELDIAWVDLMGRWGKNCWDSF